MLGPLATESATHLAALLFILAFAYCIPSLVAWNRSHHNTSAIVALNMFLGWTVLGWVGALVWALTKPPKV